MNWDFARAVRLFFNDNSRMLLEGKWGIEREAQRVTPEGELALTPHPEIFGNKLHNPEVTTDFSESQLELITPPFDSVEKTHDYLKDLQQKVEKELGDELLWPFSMPPRLPEEDKIPVSSFDGSPLGKEKELYRKGLAARYGKKMQMISGIHYNFSFGEDLINYLFEEFGGGWDKRTFVDDMYFKMARNYLRYRWLLIYLFGASPVADSTYDSVIERELGLINRCCPECCSPRGELHENAISLRVSRFGYSDSVQGKYSISFNSLGDYIKGIRRLLNTKSRSFMKLGLYKDGTRIQLNGNVLQKESEFYSPIRLKQITLKGETQLEALYKRGVKYTELRILDLDPYEKTGIGLNELRFLQVFMLFCLFEESKPIHRAELERINKNHHLIAISGRKRNLKLNKFRMGKISIPEWSSEIFNKLNIMASVMDRVNNDGRYQACIVNEYKKITDPLKLPSSLISNEIKQKGKGFLDFGIRKALEHRQQTVSETYFYYSIKNLEASVRKQ